MGDSRDGLKDSRSLSQERGHSREGDSTCHAQRGGWATSTRPAGNDASCEAEGRQERSWQLLLHLSLKAMSTPHLPRKRARRRRVLETGEGCLGPAVNIPPAAQRRPAGREVHSKVFGHGVTPTALGSCVADEGSAGDGTCLQENRHLLN